MTWLLNNYKNVLSSDTELSKDIGDIPCSSIPVNECLIRSRCEWKNLSSGLSSFVKDDGLIEDIDPCLNVMILLCLCIRKNKVQKTVC